MAIAASLDIVLGATTQKLEKGLNAASSQLKAFGGGLGGIFSSGIAGFAGLVGSIFSVNKAISAFMSTFEELNQLGRSAEILGIAPDALAGLQMQAENSELSVEQMNKALGMLGKRTEDTVTPLDVQFRNAAERIANTSSEVEKIKIATDLFGKSGIELIPILNQGAAGFDAAQQHAKELGIAVSQIDMKHVQQMDDAVDELGNAWKGASNTIVAKSAPAITDALNAVTDTMENKNAFGNKGGRGDFVGNWSDRIIMRLMGVTDMMGETKHKTDESMKVQAEAMAETGKHMDELGKKADKLKESLRTPFDELFDTTNDLFEMLDKKLIDPEQFDKGLAEARQKFKDGQMKLAKENKVGDFLGIADGIQKAFAFGGDAMQATGEFMDWAGEKAAEFADQFKFSDIIDIGQPGAAEKGTMEAFDVQNSIQRQQFMDELNVANRQLAELQKANQLSDKIRTAVEKWLIGPANI